MPWYEREQPSSFDKEPIKGLYFLNGDVLAKQYGQEWVRGKKYAAVAYPSGLVRELWNTSDEGGIINIFGAFELPRQSNREEGFLNALDFAEAYGYTLGRRGNNELLVYHPYTTHGYAITFDNQARTIMNVKRFPEAAMEILDAQSRAVLPELYSNEKLGLDAIAPIKLFTPDSHWSWYPTEYDGEDTLFGLVFGLDVELGYFSVSELEGVRGPLRLPIERDLYFTPTTLGDLMTQHNR